jgi:phage terminase large subunit-like protein
MTGAASSPSWQRPAVTTLDLPKPKGAYFDKEAAQRAVDFFLLLPIIDGPKAGQPLELLPWMEHEIVRPLFGWKRADGTRLYRECYLRVARKNGKSTICAGIAGVCMFADDEPGARIYAAAVDRDQAKEVFQPFSDMVRASRDLNPDANTRVKVGLRSVEYRPMSVPGAPARFYVLSGDTKNKDGLNVHCGILDELHAHPSPEMYELLTQGTASRRQPLIISPTTAGVYSKESVCVGRDDYTRKVASGVVEDPAFLGIIYEPSEGDDWRLPETWAKANPSLGVTISEEFLKRECAKAQSSPALENAFRTKHCNEWVQQVVRWISLEQWDASAGMVVEPDLRGEVCWGGLFIGSSTGLAAWVLTFPTPDGAVGVVPRFFLPRAEMDATRPFADRYSDWERNGLLTVTPGNALSYEFIHAQILKDAGVFDVQGLQGLRTFRGAQLMQDLVEEFGEDRVMDFHPSYPRYKFAVTELERLLAEGLLHHGGHPVLRYMADSITVRRSPEGDLRPDRDASTGPIEGIIALLMSLDMSLKSREMTPGIEIIDF